MKSIEEVLDAAAAEGHLTSGAAMDGPSHSTGFLAFSELPDLTEPTVLAVDLGTGGGIPGLVLASRTLWHWSLVDRSETRTAFLRWAVRSLGLEDRVEVILSDAVEVARGALRSKAGVVTARGFASPASTAECAAPLLEEGGLLMVSEPPIGSEQPAERVLEAGGVPWRWPAEGLSQLGVEDLGGWLMDGATYRALRRIGMCPERFPRRFVRQIDEPLFGERRR
tara:strand:- start:618 stop:1289 length:672 start_codon:yes stop_codon:yes gene_type:complete